MDEVSRAMRYCFDTWTVPVWANFAMCVFLDIQDVIGDTMELPFKNLQADVRSAIKYHEENMVFHDPFSLYDEEPIILKFANSPEGLSEMDLGRFVKASCS